MKAFVVLAITTLAAAQVCTKTCFAEPPKNCADGWYAHNPGGGDCYACCKLPKNAICQEMCGTEDLKCGKGLVLVRNKVRMLAMLLYDGAPVLEWNREVWDRSDELQEQAKMGETWGGVMGAFLLHTDF
ncbi:hypothetical protein CC78DRAFT_614204 [Lojkania enalia]|uniref:Uncharacterized protein n=1 Tax=Lojkania enalia TaxID=147567 RepID=A0A9P4KE02_9PLEO|nr:hypothetical protein CC78DRAFT_614204 [Didymosphaeria enalia]